MAISDKQAAAFGLLAMYAEDMYTVGSLNPPADPRIAGAGWTIEGYVTAHCFISAEGRRAAAVERRSDEPCVLWLSGQKQC
jgi:hypothetical protein